MRAPRSIAVIGGGAAAAILLAHLAEGREGAAVTVDVYDRAARFARGIAYSTQISAHLLNVRAASMSAYHTRPRHFADWAACHGYAPGDFVPRVRYGDYLEEIFQAAEATFPVRRITADVTACAQHAGGGYDLAVAGKATRYDVVVQATGNVAAFAPAADQAIQGFYPDPWAIPLSELAAARAIVLIGSGLTAIDMICALHAAGYSGSLTIVSRHGLLPQPHTDPAVWPDFVATAPAMPLSRRLRVIRAEIARAAAKNIPWQAVIDSLRPVTNALWLAMTPVERQRFRRHGLTLWNVHRHRMAPAAADIVEALRREGRIHVHRDRVESIISGPAAAGRRAIYAGDAVINCLGYSYQEPGRNYETSIAIGPARFGPLFETTAIPEIRVQAHDAAKEILYG